MLWDSGFACGARIIKICLDKDCKKIFRSQRIKPLLEVTEADPTTGLIDNVTLTIN